ncbi:hypothetical protein G7K_4627-t1 [Saitoella complicata NRRL Y-17804]|uniref:Uncharacterized protein n=1 Tax=Saitoella complicata (strain BCRC 22490 / CBS 7301 / JCM 7358 / NBRC 10748 / NRRL Y-17804) TaxID=698492 RepID=A0A0E9NL26_SAICN|nr:hypothetical protein G7K_4627-t1 [Saitoella complicata NRRL Y-17804]
MLAIGRVYRRGRMSYPLSQVEKPHIHTNPQTSNIDTERNIFTLNQQESFVFHNRQNWMPPKNAPKQRSDRKSENERRKLLACPVHAHVIVEQLQEPVRRLDVQLGAAPVSALGVVLDLVVSPQADPLGDGAVLLSSLGELLLGTESLVGRL